MLLPNILSTEFHKTTRVGQNLHLQNVGDFFERLVNIRNTAHRTVIVYTYINSAPIGVQEGYNLFYNGFGESLFQLSLFCFGKSHSVLFVLANICFFLHHTKKIAKRRIPLSSRL